MLNSYDSNFFGSHSFFGRELIPCIEKVGHRLITANTTYEHQDSLAYLYVFDGRGHININGVNYAIQRGSCLALMNFQLYRFLPEPAQALQISYCRMKGGAMYAFWSSPYYQPPDFQKSHNKTSQVWNFPDQQLDEIEQLWRTIYDCQFQTDAYAKQKQLYILMEYLGYFHRLCYQ